MCKLCVESEVARKKIWARAEVTLGRKGIGFKSVFKVADKGLGIFKTVSILFQQTETSWNGYAGVDRI
jgi:hypothetical protein